MTRTVAAPAGTTVPAVPAHRRELPLAAVAGLAVAGGACTVLAFPHPGWWPAAPVGVALLAVALHRRSARVGALAGGAYGFTFFAISVFWLRVVGYDAWLVLSAIEALYLAGMGAGIALVTRLRWWPLWSACCWVGQELVRSRWPLGGFSWSRLAFGETGAPYTPLAQLGGAPLVTFAVALTGGLLAWAALHLARNRGRRPWAAAAAAGAVFVALCGLLVPQPAPSGRTVTVAVVQGNVPHEGLDFLGQREAVLHNHVDATHRLAALVRSGRFPEPDFVVWPENASDIDPFANPDAHALIDGAVRDIGVPTLVGTLVETPDGHHLRNTGVVWDPRTGPGERYVKQHLVPLGEYIPFRSLLTRFIGRLDRIPQDFVPGHEPGRLQIAGYRIGDVMCFEVAYDGIVRAAARGAQVLTVQTNNATYGGTLQLDQQFAISRLRAVEHARPLVIAATSGISAVVDARGHVIDRSPEFTPALFVERLPLVDTVTLADRLGPWPERGLAVAGLLAVAFAAYRRRAAREAG